MRVLEQGNPLQVAPEPLVVLRSPPCPFVDFFFGRRGSAFTPPPHQPSPDGSASATPAQGGSDWPGSAGVPPASLFLMGVAEHQRDFAGSHHVGREPQRPGPKEKPRRRWVDPSTGEGRGCARPCAGGTPALPGSLRPHDKPGTWVYTLPGKQARRLMQASPTPPPGGSDLEACKWLLARTLGKVSTLFPVYWCKGCSGFAPWPRATGRGRKSWQGPDAGGTPALPGLITPPGEKCGLTRRLMRCGGTGD